jgi:hypothetical protein
MKLTDQLTLSSWRQNTLWTLPINDLIKANLTGLTNFYKK